MSVCVCVCCREADITKERIQKILSTGANVILTTGGIDDLCLKYFVEAGAMAVRRCKKADLKRIAKATGGQFDSAVCIVYSSSAKLKVPCCVKRTHTPVISFVVTSQVSWW